MMWQPNRTSEHSSVGAAKDVKVFGCSDERAFIPYERIERISFGFPIQPAQAGCCSPLLVSQSHAPVAWPGCDAPRWSAFGP